MEAGQFKIRWNGVKGTTWAYFEYRVRNGVTEIKERDNRFAEWRVGSIPSGAVLC